MGVDNHLGHPGQQNHQIYHPELGEMEADDRGSSHPGWDGLKEPDSDPSWGNQARTIPLPAIDMTLSPR